MPRRKRNMKRNIGTSSTPCRADKSFMAIIRESKARALLDGRALPTTPMITKKIAKKLKSEGWYF